MYAEFFARHEKVALLYSGGKDALACLHLLKEHLPKITVLWVNTGAAFPEIAAAMDELKKLTPNFLEVVSDQPANIRAYGHPVDVLPVNHTNRGAGYTNNSGVRMQSYIDCCEANVWKPMTQAVHDLGFTGVVHGQRLDESHVGELRDGVVCAGVEFLMPIQSWTSDQVLAYLESQGVSTIGRLAMPHSSLDCWDCTAYCAQGRDRMKYIKANHPEKYQQVISIMTKINEAVATEMQGLQSLVNEV
jgi:phosphoadenosine phosphosulfate reductase